MKMISPYCEKCEMLNLEAEFPCDLEETIRCSILHEYAKKESSKQEFL